MAQHTLPQTGNASKAVGEFLRNLRVNAGTAGKALVLTEVAARSGICIGALSEAERGIRFTWNTIQGHIEACTGTKAKANAALATARRLFAMYEEETSSGAAKDANEAQTGSDAVKRQARAYWNRRPGLRMPTGMKSFEDGVLCLSSLSDRSGISLRPLAESMAAMADCKISHTTLGHVLHGNAPLTPARLRGLLIAHQVPYKSWESWSNFFRKHDPAQRGKEYWTLLPTPETLTAQREQFGAKLLQALGEDVIINKYAALAGVDIGTINKLFDGEHVPHQVISRALKAARRCGIPQATMRKLINLAAPLQLPATA